MRDISQIETRRIHIKLFSPSLYLNFPIYRLHCAFLSAHSLTVVVSSSRRVRGNISIKAKCSKKSDMTWNMNIHKALFTHNSSESKMLSAMYMSDLEWNPFHMEDFLASFSSKNINNNISKECPKNEKTKIVYITQRSPLMS